MRTTREHEAAILANLSARRDAFDGFAAEELADYAETVRIENETRAERTVCVEDRARVRARGNEFDRVRERFEL